jgi:hypothetical protein
MLYHSFSHVPSVGAKTERDIWNGGVTSWDDFTTSPPNFLSPEKSRKIASHLQISRKRLQEGDARYFYHNLDSGERWRMFREFQDSAAYLDIETTGLSRRRNVITTIALYDGTDVRYYVNGRNLDDFPRDIMQYGLIITYNGGPFDLPFIEHYFDIHLPHPHIDLRYLLQGIGYSGGLKACERQLGIGRSGTLAEVDGFLAVQLWNNYRRNRDEKSLETLLAYNIEDVLNLEHLMVRAYNIKLGGIPLPIEKLSLPPRRTNPFEIDSDSVRRIKETRWY